MTLVSCGFEVEATKVAAGPSASILLLDEVQGAAHSKPLLLETMPSDNIALYSCFAAFFLAPIGAKCVCTPLLVSIKCSTLWVGANLE